MPKDDSKPSTSAGKSNPKLEEENKSLREQLQQLQAEAGKQCRYPNESWIEAVNRRAKGAKTIRDRLKVNHQFTMEIKAVFPEGLLNVLRMAIGHKWPREIRPCLQSNFDKCNRDWIHDPDEENAKGMRMHICCLCNTLFEWYH